MGNTDNEEKEVFVLELLSEIKRQSKRWMTAFFVVLMLCAATIAGFVLFLNQYEFESIRRMGADITTSTLAIKETL